MHPPLFALALALAASPLAAAAAATAVPPATHPGAGQTIYFVLTDRFANGDPSNDRGGIPGGPDDHGFDPSRISHYHGGDFAGLAAHLDYLQGLGVTAVWVTPPFRNKPFQRGIAGYHGYWILDFLHIDPHLGTDTAFRDFVRAAHARGMRVYMDIVVNHTADVIQFADGTSYRDRATTPGRDAAGAPFDERAFADNGLGDPGAFPTLSAATSFARRPLVPAAELHAKTPDWLNDPTLYHNRGDSTFQGESSIYGDFAGLDDLFTEHPRVVRGFIEVFTSWLESTGIDGFRIDTARHVNSEFWQAFIPELRARALARGRPDFLQFGEVYHEAGDPALLSEFSTDIPIDTTLDFGFFAAARRFLSQGGPASALAAFFADDDLYTDHDGDIHATPTFLGNHDTGRFAYFLQRDNPGATPALLADLVRLGHGLLFLSRGQPVLYYGDEQGLVGRGGNDMQARESLFASQAPDFRDAPLLATTHTGADDKFDTAHPFYRLFSQLAALRAAHQALRTGSMLPRPAGPAGLFAFSRFARNAGIEYLVAVNAARTTATEALVPTSQPLGARLRLLFCPAADAVPQELLAGPDGTVRLSLPPLQFAVWLAEKPLPPSAAQPRIAFARPSNSTTLEFTAREFDGLRFPSRQELRAEVAGGDGFGEVSFLLERASRPSQYEFLGTDDAPPYRVFWRPPPDLAPDETLVLHATFDDRRGHRSTATVAGIRVSAPGVAFGIRGATVPRFNSLLPGRLVRKPGEPLGLTAPATGTGPIRHLWLRNGRLIPNAEGPAPAIPAEAGSYLILARNRAGTAVAGPVEVVVEAAH